MCQSTKEVRNLFNPSNHFIGFKNEWGALMQH
jgi:hypothetical protein